MEIKAKLKSKKTSSQYLYTKNEWKATWEDYFGKFCLPILKSRHDTSKRKVSILVYKFIISEKVCVDLDYWTASKEDLLF